MLSLWSQWMLMLPLRARLTSAMQMGSRSEAAMYTTSHIRAKPALLVAVKVRAPAAAEPTAALIAECSLSTRIISVVDSPLATNSANLCIISVWGVMGKADATWGLACLKA